MYHLVLTFFFGLKQETHV